jgi:hypothetical protein
VAAEPSPGSSKRRAASPNRHPRITPRPIQLLRPGSDPASGTWPLVPGANEKGKRWLTRHQLSSNVGVGVGDRRLRAETDIGRLASLLDWPLRAASTEAGRCALGGRLCMAGSADDRQRNQRNRGGYRRLPGAPVATGQPPTSRARGEPGLRLSPLRPPPRRSRNWSGKHERPRARSGAASSPACV